ncbi:hypothetical protein K440DRAFT_646591 [Wilcoxina mikolae CBS 423.85]|nr:hypothetical protein K440DRAFT_646591 [Wilcoxina mikolae CBS 423.85]
MADDRLAAVAALVLDGLAVQAGYGTPNRRPSTNGRVKAVDAVGAGEARGVKGAVGSTVGAGGTVKFIGKATPVEVGVMGAVMEAEVREAKGVVEAEVVRAGEVTTVGGAMGAIGAAESGRAGEVVGAEEVGITAAVGVRVEEVDGVISVAAGYLGAINSNIARASAAVIFAVTQLWSAEKGLERIRVLKTCLFDTVVAGC